MDWPAVRDDALLIPLRIPLVVRSLPAQPAALPRQAAALAGFGWRGRFFAFSPP